MGLANELTLGTVRPPAVHMTIGTLPASDPALLHTRCSRPCVPFRPRRSRRSAHSASTATPNLVSLGGGTTESVYSTPTTTGTLVGICMAATADAGAAGECERILATVRLASGGVLGTAGGVSYAKALDGVIARLNAIRARAGAQLASAHTTASLCAPHRQPDHTRGFRNLTPRAGF